MFVRNMSVSRRSALGFGLIGTLLVLLGLFALQKMSQMHSETEEVSGTWLPGIEALGNLNQQMARIRIYTMRLVLVQIPQGYDTWQPMLAQLLRLAVHLGHLLQRE